MTIAQPAPPTEEHDHDHHDGPHACNDGWVTLSQIVLDPETGEETEEHALYLCRRCASEAGRWPRPDKPCSHHERGRHQGEHSRRLDDSREQEENNDGRLRAHQ